MTPIQLPSGLAIDIASAGAGAGANGFGQQTLAEAAHYAVLCRVAPMLRHDMAGALQPLGMVAMVLQRRIQAAEPDLHSISKNVASIGSLTKEAAAGCMNAIGWLAPREDPAVSWRSGVENVLQVLAIELSGCRLEPANCIPEGAATAPESYFRTVFAGALLAFCDQCTVAGPLQIVIDDSQNNAGGQGRPRLCLSVPSSGEPKPQALRSRPILWQDVQALATCWGAEVVMGDGWMTVGLPCA